MSDIVCIGSFQLSVNTFIRILKIKNRIYVDVRKEERFGDKKFPTKIGVCLTLREYDAVIRRLKESKVIQEENFSGEKRSVRMDFTLNGGAMLKLDKGESKQVVDLSNAEITELLLSRADVESIVGTDEVDKSKDLERASMSYFS